MRKQIFSASDVMAKRRLQEDKPLRNVAVALTINAVKHDE